MRLHPFAEFDIGLPRNHKAFRADDELRGDREKKRLISLVFFKFNADFLVQPPDLGADPEDKAKRKRITEVDVAQNGKRQTIARAVGARETRAVRHDRNDACSKLLYLVVDRRKRLQLKLAVRAPMTTVDADHHRPRTEQRRERNQTSVAVRQVKMRH